MSSIYIYVTSKMPRLATSKASADHEIGQSTWILSMTVLDQLCSICRSFDSIVTNVCPTSQIFTNACPESIVAHSLWELPAIHCPTS